MKKFFTFIILTAITAATSTAQKQVFTVNGTINNSKNGDTVFYASNTNFGYIPIDTAFVKNSEFKFEHEEKQAELRTIIAIRNGKTLSGIDVIAVPNSDIKLNFNDQTGTVSYQGDRNNEIWQQARNYEYTTTPKIEQQYILMNDTTKTLSERLASKRQVDSLVKTVYDNYAQTAYSNMPLPVCGLILRYFGSTFTPDQVEAIIQQMATKMPEDPVYKSYIAQAQQRSNSVSVGDQFREVAMLDLNGNMKKLSEVIKNNKVTLVDFWASWCAPCRAEMPNVKRVYNEYHNKGLEIFGVSFDENMVSWQNSVQKLQMPWINVSDLKGWESAAAKTYNIRGIPATLLIDSNGVIIAKDLRGQSLQQKISEILK